MVTDKQFNELLKRIDELEKKINMVSRAVAESRLRSAGSTLKYEDPTPEAKRDVTKYSFNGNLYSKRHLVLAVVKQYITDHSVHDSKELEAVFPDYIQGSLGVFRRVNTAEAYYDSSKRFFFKDEDLLYLDDGLFAVCREWSIKNIKRFQAVAETLGYDITPVYRDFN